jgi:hypothetical protein
MISYLIFVTEPALEYGVAYELGHLARRTLPVPAWIMSSSNRYSIGRIKPPQPTHGASPTWCGSPERPQSHGAHRNEKLDYS